MDTHVLDTINKANTNIETLIEEIIGLRKEIDRSYCIYPEAQADKKCNGCCDICKESYYEGIYNEMVKEYSVKL